MFIRRQDKIFENSSKVKNVQVIFFQAKNSLIPQADGILIFFATTATLSYFHWVFARRTLFLIVLTRMALRNLLQFRDSRSITVREIDWLGYLPLSLSLDAGWARGKIESIRQTTWRFRKVFFYFRTRWSPKVWQSPTKNVHRRRSRENERASELSRAFFFFSNSGWFSYFFFLFGESDVICE